MKEEDRLASFITSELRNQPLKNYNTREIEILESILPVMHANMSKVSKSEIVHILNIMDQTVNHRSLLSKYCKFHKNVAKTLRKLDMYEELFTFSTKYHLALKTSVGDKDVNTLVMKRYIGESLKLLRRREEAATIYEELYLFMRTVLGDSHEEILETGYRYSSLLLKLDRTQEAFEILQKIYQERVIIHGKDGKRAKETLDLIAVSLRNLGKIGQAKIIHEELLAFYSEHYEKTDRLVLSTKFNIALGLYSERKYAEAKNLLNEVMKAKFENKSSDDIFAAKCMFWIAQSDKRTGELKEALEGFESALAIRRTVLGEMHPSTLGALEMISAIKVELGILF